jgi:hypothetical protein
MSGKLLSTTKPPPQDVDTDAALPRLFATPEQAAEIINSSVSELTKFRRKGGGPPFVLVGQRPRYPLDDLMRWADSLQRFASNSEAYAANRKRAEGADVQRATLAEARKTRWPKKAKAKPAKPARPRRRKVAESSVEPVIP